MTVNYFIEPYDVASEQDLMNDLLIESIQQYGDDVRYIPRHLANFDKLLGADDSSRFDKAYTVEMQVINVYGFGGDKDFYSKFGAQVRDELVLSVSRDRWNAEVGVYESKTIPSEGDLIYIKRYDKIFSIKYVDPREMFYQLGKVYTWELTCEVFEYSGEDIATGDDDIDDVSLASTNDVDWAFIDNDGTIFTDEEDDILLVDEFSLDDVDPGAENDYLPPELETDTGLDVNTEDPFGFLQGQGQ